MSHNNKKTKILKFIFSYEFDHSFITAFHGDWWYLGDLTAVLPLLSAPSSFSSQWCSPRSGSFAEESKITVATWSSAKLSITSLDEWRLKNWTHIIIKPKRTDVFSRKEHDWLLIYYWYSHHWTSLSFTIYQLIAPQFGIVNFRSACP